MSSIDEMKAARTALEADILTKIREFESTYGANVECVRLVSSRGMCDRQERTDLVLIDIKY